MKYLVYLLITIHKKKTLTYVGYTNDLKKRLFAHNNSTVAKYTKGKKWISEVGNLFGSFFFPLEKKYPPFNEFSIINPVIIYDVIENFCKKENISFKWPNDVFVNGKRFSKKDFLKTVELEKRRGIKGRFVSLVK